jgi:glycosyltransferase involved in cell wall biosynthesis
MSNAPWAGTGYGQQTRLILKELRNRGHEPVCFAFYGLSGGSVEYDDYLVLPNTDFEDWGNDVIKAHSARSEAETVITLMDLFVLDPHRWKELTVPWIAWTPIDHEGIGGPTFDRLKHVDFPIAMSQFGAKQMWDVGVKPTATIYHTVDTDAFRPMDKTECRQKLGIDEDAYIIGMVMANKGDRKQFPLQLRAVKQWMESQPDVKVRIYLHTEPTPKMGGWDMRQLVDRLGLKGKIFSTNQYDTKVVPAAADLMATIYNSFDVLMNVSAGEGFGIPIVEAQACGIPVITGNYTSMPEITKYGYVVEPAVRVMAPHYGYHFIPDIEDMVYRLECVYRMATHNEGEVARQWVIENCSVPVIADKWEALLGAVIEGSLPRRSGAALGTSTRPQLSISQRLKVAREAMEQEAKEYGDYDARVPEYAAIFKALERVGLRSGDRILDLGAGLCDLDRFLREYRWWGTYVPVDLLIDGTDLNDYEVPEGFEYIVIQQTLEHVEEPWMLLKQCEHITGAVVITTPNRDIVGVGEKEDYPHQMAHKHWFSPEDFKGRGYEVELLTMTGRPDDTILATKACWSGVRGLLEQSERVGV